ncbi:MAG: HNH endonuclease [Candidatus Aenigmarchaeota archaeon]|nr:HNH endonuclease [Candidatus Aenigmarchaeota archaeon]
MVQQRIKKLLQYKRIDIDLSKCCWNCGEDNPTILRKFEWHHIFGKANNSETILLCPNCHAKITSEQNKLSPQIRKCSSSKAKKRFKMISQGALLKLIGEELIKDASSC